jgi:hypothetical protein
VVPAATRPHRSLRSKANSAKLSEPLPPFAGDFGDLHRSRLVRGLNYMGSLIKKRRKKMSKHKYRKRIKANRHKRKR